MAFVAMLSSCYTSSKFIVEAVPGTEILTPDRVPVAVADNQGKAKVIISDDEFYAFLLSHQPGTQDYIPFALDYKYKSYTGTRVQYWLGWFLACGGMIPTIVGVVAVAQGDDDTALPLFGLGAGMIVAGTAMGFPANCRSDQRNQDNQYKFLSQQRTNQDLPITIPILVSENVSREKPVQPKQVVAEADSSTVSTRKIGQRSNKTLKDYGTQLQGTYIGTGKLTKGKETIESYNGITVIITRMDKDMVLVNVVESNGEPFFPSESQYKVEKKNNNSYELTLEGINSAKIKIDKDKNCLYLHPRVNIDGDLYTLSIDAKLKK